jgi:uncharacterized protein YciI
MYYLYKLIPPRPTFHLDTTAEEKEIMGRHIAYWTALTDKGMAIVFGPVFDPAGVYGLGIIEVDSEDRARQIAAQDPAILAGGFTNELFPMDVGLIRR